VDASANQVTAALCDLPSPRGGLLRQLPSPRRLAGAAFALLLLGGCHATAIVGRAGIALALAEVVLLAGILALVTAQAAGNRALEAQVARAEAELCRRAAFIAEQLEAARREAQMGEERSKRFTQLVVHDLRNPLAAVIANVAFAEDALAGRAGLAETLDALRVAHGEGNRLSAMIADLLLVPRLEGAELAGQFSATRIRAVLDDVAGAVATRARAKQLRLEVAAAGELVAWLDGSLVRRMVENLVANGLRHTPRGGRIELSAEVVRGRLRLAVRNSGDPIPATVRARLFERYATSAEGDVERSGLGLYLCRLVAEAHGGRIALAEREGWNVSFEAELPLSPERITRRHGEERTHA
jgi:signal transduction histidine kinase